MVKTLKKVTVNLLMGANVVSILLMLFVGYSDRFSPQEHPMLSCIGLIFPILLLVNLGFLAFWTVVSLKRVLLPLAGFLLCYGPVRNYLPLNVGLGDDYDLKILTYNAGGYSENQDGVYGRGLKAALSYVCSLEDVDIACLQEVHLNKEQVNELHQQFPYIYTFSPKRVGHALTFLSKHKASEMRKIIYEVVEGDSAWVSIAGRFRIDGQDITVINTHFESYGLSMKEREDFQSIVHGNKERDTARTESRRLVVKLSEHNVKRSTQVKAVTDFLKTRADDPVIVCGDFNDTPISYTHYQMAEHLTDCYRECGNGLGWTFNSNSIHVRIDHFFCSDHFTPVSCKVDKNIDASDHFPILCTLKKEGKSQK